MSAFTMSAAPLDRRIISFVASQLEKMGALHSPGHASGSPVTTNAGDNKSYFGLDFFIPCFRLFSGDMLPVRTLFFT
jgi:hypothetical protein